MSQPPPEDPGTPPGPPVAPPTWPPAPPPAPPAPPTWPPAPAPGQYGAPAPGQYGGPPPPGAYGAPPPGAYGAPGYVGGQPTAMPYAYGMNDPDWDAALGVSIAPAGMRILAKAIDVILVLVIAFALGAAFGAALFATSDSSGFRSGTFDSAFTANLGTVLAFAAISLVVDFVYNVVTVALWGGQPGKLMCGLRIERVDRAPVSWATALLRWSPIAAIIVLSNIPLLGIVFSLARLALIIANLVMIFVVERRRDVFDLVAGTVVVKRRG